MPANEADGRIASVSGKEMHVFSELLQISRPVLVRYAQFLVSLPLAFSKQKAKMMAQKLGAALPFVCPNPQL